MSTGDVLLRLGILKLYSMDDSSDSKSASLLAVLQFFFGSYGFKLGNFGGGGTSKTDEDWDISVKVGSESFFFTAAGVSRLVDDFVSLDLFFVELVLTLALGSGIEDMASKRAKSAFLALF